MVRATSRILLILCGLLRLGSAAHASNLLVPSQYATIQAGINAAVTGDVVLVADGTYTGTGNQGLDFGGRVITVRSQSGDPTKCIIDCQSAGRGFLFHSGETSASVLSGFTIQNGAASLGAGIYCQNNSGPTITGCLFANNVASGRGGGICNDDSSPIITDCTFTGNSAVAGGGMDNNDSSSTVTNCVFIGNNAGSGGGVNNGIGKAAITNCIFIGNSATNGGGMCNFEGNPTVTNCTFTGNNGDAAGMENDGSSPTVTNCILWGDNDIEVDQRTAHSVFNDCDIQDVDFLQGRGYVNGSGNFDADPLFVRAPLTNGSDDFGDVHLQLGSPCIDAGDDAALPADTTDLNNNGNTTEPLPIDLAGGARIHGTHVDLGAYEFNRPPLANAGADQNLTAQHSGNPATDTASVTFNGSASSDPEGDTLSYTWNDGQGHTTTGAKPTLALPAGTYTFTLTVSDAYGLFSTDTVQIVVNPASDQAPSANSQSLSLKQDTNLPITLSGSDPEGDAITYQVATSPAHGTLSGTAPNLTYTPKLGYFGSDSFTFTVTDPYGAVSNTATVAITVVEVPKLKVTLSEIGRIGRIVGVIARVTNTSTTKATNVKLTSARLIGVNAFLGLPCAPFSLKAGQSQLVLLSFYPLNKGQKGTLNIQGTSSLGGFALDQTVTIP